MLNLSSFWPSDPESASRAWFAHIPYVIIITCIWVWLALLCRSSFLSRPCMTDDCTPLWRGSHSTVRFTSLAWECSYQSISSHLVWSHLNWLRFIWTVIGRSRGELGRFIAHDPPSLPWLRPITAHSVQIKWGQLRWGQTRWDEMSDMNNACTKNFVVYIRCMKLSNTNNMQAGPSRREGTGSFPGPRDIWGPPSLKNKNF